jgi:hypothetical protein
MITDDWAIRVPIMVRLATSECMSLIKMAIKILVAAIRKSRLFNVSIAKLSIVIRKFCVIESTKSTKTAGFFNLNIMLKLALVSARWPMNWGGCIGVGSL